MNSGSDHDLTFNRYCRSWVLKLFRGYSIKGVVGLGLGCLLSCMEMIRVVRAATGAELTALSQEDLRRLALEDGQAVRGLMRHLHPLCGKSRFCQKLLDTDGSILSEGTTLEAPVELQLVLLPFADASVSELDELVSAVGHNRVDAVESILRRSSSANV